MLNIYNFVQQERTKIYNLLYFQGGWSEDCNVWSVERQEAACCATLAGRDGMISHIVSAYSNKFVFGYLGIVSIGVLGFIV